MIIKPAAGVEVNSRLSTPLFLIVPHILASFTQYTCWQQSEFFKKKQLMVLFEKFNSGSRNKAKESNLKTNLFLTN